LNPAGGVDFIQGLRGCDNAVLSHEHHTLFVL